VPYQGVTGRSHRKDVVLPAWQEEGGLTSIVGGRCKAVVRPNGDDDGYIIFIEIAKISNIAVVSGHGDTF
jgi:hypothetical protein